MCIDIDIAQKLKKNKKLYSNWVEMVTKYYKTLNEGAFFSDVTFTPHDYEHHCINIYNHLYTILPESFYKHDKKGESLFILMVAVLFHDYALTLKSSEDFRKSHSKIARDKFLEEMHVKSSVISQNIPVDSWGNYIADIIYAHSDIKETSQTKHTLKEIINKYKDDPILLKINVTQLAGLLRFADELDITYARLKGTHYYEKFINGSSKPHFDKLQLFSEVHLLDSKTLALKLRFEDPVLNSSKEYQAGLIVEVYEKVYASLKEVNKLIFSTAKYKLDDFNIENIKIYNPNNPEDSINNYLSIILTKKKVIDDASREIISIFKANTGLLSDFGGRKHWIDIKLLLTTTFCNDPAKKDKLFSEYVSDIISKDMIELLMDKKYSSIQRPYIVGINFYGALLSGLIGYRTNKAFSFAFYENGKFDSDRIISINDDLLIIITDVFCTGQTVLNFLKELQTLGIGKNRVVVYSIFQCGRDCSDDKTIAILTGNEIEKIIVLDNSCAGETLCLKDQCKLR